MYRHLFTIFFSFFYLIQAHASERLDLLNSFAKALNYDARYRAALNNQLGQRESVDQALAAFLPQARISAFEGQGVKEKGSTGGHRVYDSNNYSFSVRQSIFDKTNFDNFGKATSIVASSESNVALEKINLMNKVISTYLDILQNIDYLNYGELQKISIQSQLDQANRRYELGSGTLTEVSEAEASMQSLIAHELEWSNDLEYSKRNLANIIGIYPNNLSLLDFRKFSVGNFQSKPINDWIMIANQSSPLIVKAVKDVEIAEYEVSKSIAGHYPTLDLIASKSKTESDTAYSVGTKYFSDSIGLQLNVPIYSGGYTDSKIRQSLAFRDEAQDKLNDQKRNVEGNIRKYYNEVSNGFKRVDAIQSSNRAYKVAYIGTKKAFFAGLKTNIEVLDAQAKFFSAQRDLVKEQYALINSYINFLSWVGVLDEKDLETLNICLMSASSSD